MELYEIRELMFTKVMGINLSMTEVGQLIGYYEDSDRPYALKTVKGCNLFFKSIEPIKEPKYRPYENASEIPLDRIMVRYKCWAKGARAPISIDKEAVYTGTSSFVKFSEALDKMEWADGTPFGVEVKE